MAAKRGKFSSLKPHQRRKFTRVMHEFAKGTLRTSAGGKPVSREQAIAIAFSEARSA